MPPPKAIAPQGCDRWLGDRVDRIPRRVDCHLVSLAFLEPLADLIEFADVGARGEIAALAGQDDAADLWVAVKLCKGARQLLPHVVGDGIALERPVQCDGGDTIRGFNNDFTHGLLIWGPGACMRRRRGVFWKGARP